MTVKGLKLIRCFSYSDGTLGKRKVIIIIIKETMKGKGNYKRYCADGVIEGVKYQPKETIIYINSLNS